jgi:hypothetical protein
MMLGRAIKVVQIDGVTFEIQPLGAIQGRRLFTKLVAQLGPALSNVAAKSGDKQEALGLSLLGGLLERLDPAIVDELAGAFSACSTVELAPGQRQKLDRVFDDYFATKYSHLTRWLLECLRINFADFLADGSLMADLKAIGASTTPAKSD